MAQRYRNSRDPNEGLEELEQERNQESQEGGDPVSTSNEGDEEGGNWKKRHGDPRKANARMEKEKYDEIAKLREQLSQAKQAEVKYPADEDEFQAWVQKYPVISRMVDTLVQKRVLEGNGMLEPKFNRVTELEKQLASERLERDKKVAYDKIVKAHPDFDKLVDDDKFQDWIGEQSEWVQHALWENETDARSAIDAVDLYKALNGAPAKKKQQEVDNASNPRGYSSGGGANPTGGSEPLFKESQVQKMSDKDYERFETQIREAIRDGRFEYDLSA